MGCRTRVIGNVYDPQPDFQWRGNLSFTTINLPRLAIWPRGTWGFFEGLDRMMDLCVDQLLERFEIKWKKVRNYPFLMGQGAGWSDNLDWDDEVREVLKHGTLSWALSAWPNAQSLDRSTTERARRPGFWAWRLSHMRQDGCVCKAGDERTLLATPAEGFGPLCQDGPPALARCPGLPTGNTNQLLPCAGVLSHLGPRQDRH